MQIRPYGQSDEQRVIDLWNRCGLLRPWNDPLKDITRKLTVQRDLFLVGVIEQEIVASVMAGFDGHRGWINYLAVAPEHRRAGYGRTIMDAAEQQLRGLGCPKINLQIRADNVSAIHFYESIGFSRDAVVSYGKRLIPDE